MPVVSAIIVSYNTRQLTLRCLETLGRELTGIDSEIFVVDNASTDDSVSSIRQAFSDVKLIENKTNRGFGSANNQAMQKAQGKYLLLLNSDAFPHANSIRALIDCLEHHPKAAVAGPKLLNEDGSLQLSCFRFPSPARAWCENLWLSSLFSYPSALADYRKWAHNDERKVDWVVGACMLVRTDAFKQVGGFDERFFMYAEESDWQKRFNDAGWDIVFTPAAQVTHLGRGSSTDSDQPARINDHFFQSLDSYELKHHGIAGLILLRLAMIVGCTLRGVLWALITPFSPRPKVAVSKLRLHWWLVFRQLTYWRFVNWTKLNV